MGTARVVAGMLVVAFLALLTAGAVALGITWLTFHGLTLPSLRLQASAIAGAILVVALVAVAA